jgi:hypothetical protein
MYGLCMFALGWRMYDFCVSAAAVGTGRVRDGFLVWARSKQPHSNNSQTCRCGHILQHDAHGWCLSFFMFMFDQRPLE